MDGQDSLNNYLVNYISEKLGITYVYDFSVAGGTYDTKVNMVMTSGEMPDVMTVNESQMRQLVAGGAVEDMTDASNTYASDNLKAAYDTTQGISFGNVTFDGKIMAMPNISPGADGIPMLFVRAPYFENANLLVAADCTAYAYGNFHRDFIRNRVTLIGCPKLDEGDYAEKLTAILAQNEIRSVTVVRMEVPCCGGLENAGKRALQASGKFIPWRVAAIATDGRAVE